MNIPEGYYKSIFGDFYLYSGDINDTTVQREIREVGVYAKDLCQWIADNVKPGWICYDIGSNVGQMAMIMSIAAKSNGAVYAFEAQARLAEAFEHGKSLSQLVDTAKINMYPIALSDKKGLSEVKIDLMNLGGATLSADIIDPLRSKDYEHEFISVDIDRLDNLHLPSPDFIKIDVEGHEAEAWLGFTQEAKECPVILAEVGSYTQEWLIDEYLGYNRKPYSIHGQKLGNTAKDLIDYLSSLDWKQDDIIFRRD